MVFGRSAGWKVGSSPSRVFHNGVGTHILLPVERPLSQHGIPVVHVKDGKPLTPEGARMLGVTWPGNERRLGNGTS